ncbi:MAG: prolyl-tRNA synthetase [Candidatus Niyogibacteria bacterium]|nr:prolyl-tRNA synthetase [Candidatus Niyogibacteria bacterium]
MRQSKLFTKTQKDAPKDEISVNAQMLARAGFTDKLMAGVYTYLPLGFRALKKIENIIREEMENAGGQEILMPSLQPKENWTVTGRWETMDDLYKVTDKSGKEFALGPTHEEIIVPLAKKFISSYKDLPLYLFQIQNKFRMELRAKSGLLRGREFLMKDLYSFHKDEADLNEYYEKMKGAYRNIFEKAGVGGITYITFASGGSFSKYSHEFQTVTSAGEDTIYLCESCRVAVNKEMRDEQDSCPVCGNKNLTEKRSIEVGNIFNLKTKFSDAFGLSYKDENGKERPVLMGCYGIGLGRLLGAIVEVHHDAKGMVWPEKVAPYLAHLINIADSSNVADNLYDELSAIGVEVLYDDRGNKSPGEKFADSDLLGMPNRVVISDKTIEAGKYEIKKRSEKEVKLISRDELLNMFKKK